MNFPKLFICSIIIVILLKILLKKFKNIKDIIKENQNQEKLKRQEELKQKELKQREVQKKETSLEELRQKKLNQDKLKEEELKNFNKKTKYDIQAIEELQRRLRQGVQNLKELRLEEIRENIIQEDIQQYVSQKAQQREILKRKSQQKQKWQMSYIDRLDNGYEFEEYIAELLEKLGYTNVEVTPISNDGGADVLAKKNGATYAFQCKWHSKNNTGKNIGYDAVQQAHSGKDLYKNERQLEEVYGIVATNSYFTNKAIDRAKILDITLWNRNKLEKLLKEARESSFLY